MDSRPHHFCYREGAVFSSDFRESTRSFRRQVFLMGDPCVKLRRFRSTTYETTNRPEFDSAKGVQILSEHVFGREQISECAMSGCLANVRIYQPAGVQAGLQTGLRVPEARSRRSKLQISDGLFCNRACLGHFWLWLVA